MKESRSLFKAQQVTLALALSLILLMPLVGSLQAQQLAPQVPPAVEETFTAAVSQAGQLTVTSQVDKATTVFCGGGEVKINGLAPGGSTTPCANITSLVVNGGSEPDRINLDGVRRALFPNLTSVMVNGGDGDDIITATEFKDTLVGGPGDDAFVGVEAEDVVDGGPGESFFIEATRSTGPPLSVVGQGTGTSGNAEAPAPLAPPIGTTIEGLDFDDNNTLTGFVFVPPDPIAASGPGHVVSVDNVAIEWYTKAGVQQYSQSLQTFFAPVTPVNFTFDPKVIYDQYEDRFVVVTLEQRDTSSGDPVDSSRILVAVSDDSDPNGTWYYHFINSLITIGGLPRWADYPGFAVDDKAVYITNNMYAFGAAGGTYGGARLWIVHKGLVGGLYAGSPATVTVHDPYASGGIATTTQPSHMFGKVPTNMGTFLVSHSGLSNGTQEFVQVVRVDDPVGTPSFTPQLINVGDIDGVGAALPNAPQTGSTGGITEIETNDRRALHSVWRDDALWMTTTIEPNSGPDTGEATAHWFQLDTFNLAAPALADQGNVGAEDIPGTDDVHTFFPSIAVDPCGNMGIGFSASSSSMYAGAYYSGRLATDAPGTVQSTGILAAGLDYYQRTFGRGRNRWGDYSGMSLDPSDEATFWVYNEYALQRGSGTAPEDGRWGTRFGSYQFHQGGADFGDLPPVYNNTNYRTVAERKDDGARHCVGGTLRLGILVDAESDGQESANVTGDDSAGLPDEDGVAQVGNWNDLTGDVDVTVTGGLGCLSAWLDYWDGASLGPDGDFDDTGEYIIINQPVDSASTQPLSFSFPLPAGTTGNTLYARFRLVPDADADGACSDQTAIGYRGSASGGEVEDYAWSIPTVVDLARFEAVAIDANTVEIEWETATELDNLGFNLYRAGAADGAKVQLNGALIPAQNPGSPLGATYTYVDPSAEANTTLYYWLEDVDANGMTILHGPASVSLPLYRRLRLIRPRPSLSPLLQNLR